MADGTSFDELGWRWDPQRVQLVAIGELESWSGYSCESSAPEAQGATVMLCVADLSVTSPHLAHVNYSKAVTWLFENEKRTHDSVAAKVLNYLPTMRKQFEEWGIDDPALDVNTLDDLREILNLAFVHLFPHRKSDLPYFGFDFDCAWDAEHGFKVLLNGSTVVALGLELEVCDSTAVEEDGGTV